MGFVFSVDRRPPDECSFLRREIRPRGDVDCFVSRKVGELSMEEQETVRKIIDQHNANLVKWYASGEIDKVVEVFAEDCWQMPPHTEPMVGRDALRAGWKQVITYSGADELERLRGAAS